MQVSAAAMGLLAILGCMSCGGLPKTYYYTLQIPPPPPGNDTKSRLLIGVERFRAPEVLRDDRIVFYETPTQLNFYQNHRWTSDPATMLSELVARRLRATGIFADVLQLPARTPVDYILRGRVLNFEEVDYGGGVIGRVGLELTLVRSRDDTTVWSDARMVERSAQGKGVPGVVNALNASSEQLLRDVLPGLIAEVERELSQNTGQSQ